MLYRPVLPRKTTSSNPFVPRHLERQRHRNFQINHRADDLADHFSHFSCSGVYSRFSCSSACTLLIVLVLRKKKRKKKNRKNKQKGVLQLFGPPTSDPGSPNFSVSPRLPGFYSPLVRIQNIYIYTYIYQRETRVTKSGDIVGLDTHLLLSVSVPTPSGY